ncbi:MAG: class I SAM-dependent methyltransferase, partial [Candidatus Thorarchaeota archaeon]
MNHKHEHYSSEFPEVKVKIHTISESLRKHLYVFKTLTGVFSFSKIDLGTKILIEHMIIPEEPGVLLDLGCGYGSIGIVLGYESPESLVYLIDVNKHAIWCAKENIKLNLRNNQNLHTLNGSYFEPIKSKNLQFDGIYMNPPLRQGRKEFLSVVHLIPDYLKSNGSFQFVIRKKMGAPFILDYLKNEFPNRNIDLLCKRSGYWVFRYFQ